MKIRIFLMVLSFLWIGLNAQTISIQIQESAGECLLSSNCEQNNVCYDVILEINEPNWQLRSYNIWFQYPEPPLFSYNSDNACLTQNGGDTDNNIHGQYRVSGINGSALLVPAVSKIIHTICFEYTDPALVVNSIITAGGQVLVFGFPFESTISLVNSVTGETAGLVLDSKDSIIVKLTNNQTIGLNEGWSGISSWLQPGDPDIELIMEPVVDDMVVMYNLTDGMYFPANGINTLHNWNYKSGYIIKTMNNGSVGFCGAEGENRNINLMAGWNIIPVLSNSNVPIGSVFDALGNNLVLVKEIAGYRLYYPAFSIATLNSLEPTKAYFVKVLSACTISFPESDESLPLIKPEYYFDLISPWNSINKTPDSHVFCFVNSSNSQFETGDLIGAFDQNGLCTGMMEVLDIDQPFVVPVFGNDQTTAVKDGLNEGEAVSFRMWRPSTGEEFNLVLYYTQDSPNQGSFVSNGISLVKNVLITSLGVHLNNFLLGVNFNVYPNPTSGICNLELAGDVNINGRLVLTDTKGQLLFKSEIHHSDITEVKLDLSAYNPGVYYVRIISGNYYNIRKIIKE